MVSGRLCRTDLQTDITTMSSLTACSEVNLQNLLRQRLGEPLITIVIHLYIHETLTANRTYSKNLPIYSSGKASLGALRNAR